jgi:hypothetical protein
LLLDLQGLQHGAFLGHVRINQVADAGAQDIDQFDGKVALNFQPLGYGAQGR